jgi:hypothetical protein
MMGDMMWLRFKPCTDDGERLWLEDKLNCDCDADTEAAEGVWPPEPAEANGDT